MILWELTENELIDADEYKSDIQIDYEKHPILFDTFGINHGDDYQGIIEFINSNEFRVAQSRVQRPLSFSQAQTNDILHFVRLKSKKPNNNNKTISFPYTFLEPSDGCGDFLVRKMNSSKTALIYLHVDLKNDSGNLRPKFTDRVEPITLVIDSEQTDVEIWIEEFQSFDRFQWNHYREQSAQIDYWEAISGTITFHTTQTEHDGYNVDAHMSNVVFKSTYSTDSTELDSMSFTNVYVGW